MNTKIRKSLIGKRFVVLLIALVIVVGGGYAYYGLVLQPAQKTNEPELRTSTARQGDLVILASGTGTLTAAEEIALGFGTNGVIAELHVQVGDEVEAGDILAVQGDREQLEAAVAADQIAVMEAQSALDELLDGAELTAAKAELDLANARDALRTSEYTWSVQQEGNRASSATINAAEANKILAANELERAEANYAEYSGRSDNDPAKANALSRLSSAQQKYDSIQRNLNWYKGHPTEIQQAMLDAEVALATAQLADAEREFERLQDGPDPEEVALMELRLKNAKKQLSLSEKDLVQSNVVAPIEGTILSVNAQLGQLVSGAFITMADLDKPYVEIYLDENDLGKIDLGYEVEVIFDALPDEVYSGEVVQVDPSLVASGGISTIHAWVELNLDSESGHENLPLGLSAAIDVISAKAEGVVLIPVEALRELEPGEHAVFVVEDGTPILRIVEVGLMDFTFAEVKSGLTAGEVVSTGIVETE
jgi:multidrug efflux pump subunit AcrA (membrane-fusion protein)